MERATGVEPATSSLGSWHSTTELRPLRPTVDGQVKSMELAVGCQRGIVVIAFVTTKLPNPSTAGNLAARRSKIVHRYLRSSIFNPR